MQSVKHKINRPFASCLLPLFENEAGAKPLNEKVFDLHENERVSKTHFHMKRFAPRFVLRQRQKATRIWLIYFLGCQHIVPSVTSSSSCMRCMFINAIHC